MREETKMVDSGNKISVYKLKSQIWNLKAGFGYFYEIDS